MTAFTDSTTLLLLFLYGNLFCYVSSYPILVFHVTRAIDFEDGKTRAAWSGYVATIVLALIVLGASTAGVGNAATPFVATVAFSGLQLYRIHLALHLINSHGSTGLVSKIYAYTYALARRRGEVEELRTTRRSVPPQAARSDVRRRGEERESQKRLSWRREFIDSYRHMREHGNSAFIFVLELNLAGLCYLLLAAFKTHGAQYQLSAVAVLLALWGIPAMFVHFIGQHIERRFSWYDQRLIPDPLETEDGTY